MFRIKNDLQSALYASGAHAMTDDELQSLQKHLLGMYQAIQDVCDRHGLTVMFFYGSMLGAVRHNGFIPWDDDLDVVMPRDDYDRFIHQYASELPDNLVLYAPGTENGPVYRFAKVIDKSTEFVEIGQENYPKRDGVFVDIFPMEYCSGSKIQLRLKRLIAFPLMFIANSVFQYSQKSESLRKVVSCSNKLKFKYMLRNVIGFMFSFLSYEAWLNLFDSLVRSPKKSDYVYIPTSLSMANWTPMPYDKFYPAVRYKIDKGEVYLPARYTDLLEFMYGDWKKVPPEHKRERHYHVRFKLQAK